MALHSRPLAHFAFVLNLGAMSLAQANPTPWDAAFGSGEVKLKSSTAPQQKPPPAPSPALAPPAQPPTPAAPADDLQGRTDAESLVATFRAAIDAGATDFASMGTPEQVVSALAIGVRGTGRFADTTFRVPGLDADRQQAALRHLRIERGHMVIGSPDPPPPSKPEAKPDGTVFAGGMLRVLVPQGFKAEVQSDGDLRIFGEGIRLNLHHEATAAGLDAWAEVREAADRAGLPVSMAGKKVYVMQPDRLRPEKVVIGFGNTLASIRVESEQGAAASNRLRLALPGIVRSLGAAGGD